MRSYPKKICAGGGVPALVEFENHKVINFYFDDKEIIDFLESDTQPLDKYWNLD